MKFTIPGEPVSKGRPRVTKFGAFTPQKTLNYETLVQQIFVAEHGQPMLEGPLRMRVGLYFGIPKSASKKKKLEMLEGKIRPTKKPDIDNCLKIIGDSLNNIAYKDDSQIVAAYISKHYSEYPRVEVELIEADLSN